MPNKAQTKNFLANVRAWQDERNANFFLRKDALASANQNGVMRAADKAKLDSISFDFQRGTLSVVSGNVTLTFAAIKEDSSS